jgi:hypothetical protein
MSHNKTVTMPLELAQFALNAVEYLALRGDDVGTSNGPVAEELRALLAAPPQSDYLASCESAHKGLTIDQAEAVEKGIDDLLFGASPAVERQEPVGEVADMKYNRVQFYRATGDTSKPYLLPGTKLYTSPPAPVAVVLPEQKQEVRAWGHDMGGNYDEGHADGWNTCLDKVKELNQ